MKNIPNKIYLQIGEDAELAEDFNELSDITWCKDKIFDSDVGFYSSNKINLQIKDRSQFPTLDELTEKIARDRPGGHYVMTGRDEKLIKKVYNILAGTE